MKKSYLKKRLICNFGKFNLKLRFKEKLFLILSLAFIFISKTLKHKTRIGLCVIGKNENLYAREFVQHYKKIGYNNIFIYDNNEKNGEYFEEVINDYIKDGYVKIINYRERDLNSRPQVDAYRDCYQKNNKFYDWLSFFDMDEFLEVNLKYKTIQDFLDDKIFIDCQNIKINWLFYSYNNNLYYENKSLEERMNHCPASKNRHIKSTVRGNLGKNYWEHLYDPHTSTLNITSCNSLGKKIKYDSPFNDPPNYTNAKLKHYYYKSFEENCLKLKRGKADRTKEINIKMINQIIKQLYLVNKNNSKKLKIIHKIFNYSIFNLYV